MQTNQYRLQQINSYAIVTKYFGPTDTKPSRIGVKLLNGRWKYYSYDHELTAKENHQSAAMKAIREDTHPDFEDLITKIYSGWTHAYKGAEMVHLTFQEMQA